MGCGRRLRGRGDHWVSGACQGNKERSVSGSVDVHVKAWGNEQHGTLGTPWGFQRGWSSGSVESEGGSGAVGGGGAQVLEGRQD